MTLITIGIILTLMIVFDLPPFRLSPGESAVLPIWRKKSDVIVMWGELPISREGFERLQKMKEQGITLTPVQEDFLKWGEEIHRPQPQPPSQPHWIIRVLPLPLRLMGMLRTERK